MKSPRLQTVCMLFFIAGFVCANSGWGTIISIWQSDRAAWSTCNEDLCLCVQPTEQEPYCPLCLLGEDSEACSGEECQPKDNAPRRVPRDPHADAISQASQVGCASIFIAFALGYSPVQSAHNEGHVARFIEPDARLAINRPDIPTPPPRA